MSLTTIRPLGPEYAAFTDDTEDSVVGSTYHQDAITVLSTSLKACGPGRGLPWYIGNQLRIILPRVNNRPLNLSPDILIHPTLGNLGNRERLDTVTEGAPALVIEVASPSTYEDRDLQDKRDIYAHSGIAEYLVFDATAALIPAVLVGWQLGLDGRYQPWVANAAGRWQSRLGIAFQPQRPYLRVYDQDGVLVPTHEENQELRRQAETERRQAEALLHEREQQLAERDAQLAALEAELRRLRGE